MYGLDLDLSRSWGLHTAAFLPPSSSRQFYSMNPDEPMKNVNMNFDLWICLSLLTFRPSTNLYISEFHLNHRCILYESKYIELFIFICLCVNSNIFVYLYIIRLDQEEYTQN